MATVTWLKTFLRKSKVPYSEMHHDPAYTAQGLAHREHLSGRQVAKVVVVIADGRPVQLVVPANRSLDLHRARLVLDAEEVRLAREDEMAKLFADCAVGAEPPLRHWTNVDLWLDESMSGAQEIVFQAGTHEDAVRMRLEDWLRLAKPRVGGFVI